MINQLKTTKVTTPSEFRTRYHQPSLFFFFLSFVLSSLSSLLRASRFFFTPFNLIIFVPFPRWRRRRRRLRDDPRWRSRRHLVSLVNTRLHSPSCPWFSSLFFFVLSPLFEDKYRRQRRIRNENERVRIIILEDRVGCQPDRSRTRNRVAADYFYSQLSFDPRNMAICSDKLSRKSVFLISLDWK